jgi:hypothetical protein
MANRLTNDIRESLAFAVLRHRFAADVAALVRDWATFADEIYCDVYRRTDRDRMAALPEGWLPTCTHVTAKFGELGSGYAQVAFDGRIGSNVLGRFQKHVSGRGEFRRVLNKHAGACSKAYDQGHKLSKRHEDLRSRQGALEQAIRESQKQIEVALNGVTTASALVKAWPEMEPFIKPYLGSEKVVPAIPTGKLNEIFKLPVKEAA